VDAELCRDTLTKLMHEESATLGELEMLLTREHEILVKNSSVEALEDACAARQISMGTLLRIQDERHSMLRMFNIGTDAAAIDALLVKLDPRQQLRSRWIECANVAKRCRDLNDRNGALVQSRMKRVEGMLEVLTGRRPGASTYGPEGRVKSGFASRLVAAEA
jgi:flagellar biosynthesis/type III secretory pathway chaperone